MLNRKLIAGILLLAPLACGAVDIEVVGLFNNKAVISVNGGKPRTMSAGDATPEGVRLISAGSTGAVIEFGGKRQTLAPGHGTRVGPAATSSGPARITLIADTRGHFTANGTINGMAVRFLVDTGATSIAMSATEAKRLGINYLAGTRTTSQTAAGVVPVYLVRLDSVRVGDITANDVEAVVIENNTMTVALLGMSFLNRVEMRREGVTMTLMQRN